MKLGKGCEQVELQDLEKGLSYFLIDSKYSRFTAGQVLLPKYQYMYILAVNISI